MDHATVAHVAPVSMLMLMVWSALPKFRPDMVIENLGAEYAMLNAGDLVRAGASKLKWS